MTTIATCSKVEIETIFDIAARAVSLCKSTGRPIDFTTTYLLLEVCHRLIPLDLDRFLNADAEDFVLAVLDILKNFDNDTGVLRNPGFLPRFYA